MNEFHGFARRRHPLCIACGFSPAGLGLAFRFDGREVTASFGCGARYQGYPDRLHGGVIATLLDAAMTHCLFAHGVTAVTATLDVRYRHPVPVGRDAEVRARIRETHDPLYVMEGEIVQGDQVRVTARAKFMATSDV